MNIKEAIEIVENYNKWRIGADIPMPKSNITTQALNVMLEFVKDRI